MAERTTEVSLKRPDGTWGGVSDMSEMEPSLGGFKTLQNFYHNRDGTELRRWLGSVTLGRPFLGEPIEIIAITPGSVDSTVELERPHLFLSGTRNVYFLDNSVVADGIYTATYVSATELTIPIVATGTQSGSAGADGRCFIQRSTSPQVLTQADGRPVVIGECDPGLQGAVDPTRRDIASWVASKRMDPDDVETPNYVDPTVTNEELAVDSGFIYWPSPTLRLEPEEEDYIVENQAAGGNNDTSYEEAWRYVYNMVTTRRLTVDVMNGRVLVAVPGHGCMFEVNVRRTRIPYQLATKSGEGLRIGEHRRTKALGIQHGSIKAITESESGGNTGWGTGVVYCAVGFFDPFTLELGLPSMITKSPAIDASTQSIKVEYFFPRALLRESFSLGTILYCSEVVPSGASPAVLFPVDMEILPANDLNRSIADDAGVGGATLPPVIPSTVITLQKPPDITRPFWPQRWPVIEVAPTGASWVKVVRSRMFKGGDAPDVVPINFFRERWTRATANDANAVSFKAKMHTAPTIPTGSGLNNIGMADGDIVPGSYLSHQLLFDNAEYDFQSLSLIRHMDPITSAPYKYTTRFEVDGDAYNDFGSASSESGHLLKRPELVGFSEEGYPGVLPGFNNLPVDQFEGGTPTGMARIGDDALVFTDRETRIFNWGALPRLATSQIVSSQWGLVAPSSAVEGPGFAAWISADGPMAYYVGGGLQWIGSGILDLWQTFQAQTDGLQGEIQGIHDRDRALIIWQVTTDYDSVADDATKSKSTCNRLLVWNYATNVFSLVTRANNARSHCLGSLPVNGDPTNRKGFRWMPASVMPTGHSAFYEIQAFDEDYQDRADQPLELTATLDSAGTGIFTCADTTGAGIFDEAYIRSPRGVLKWFGRVTSVDATTVTLDTTGAVWKSGDIMEVKVITASLVTNWLSYREVGIDQSIRGGALRLIRNLPRANVSTHTAYMWARFRVEKQNETIVNFSKNSWGDPVADGVTRFTTGSIQAEQFRVRIDIIGNVQVWLKDATVMVTENK